MLKIDREKKSEVVPILVIAAARSGGTSLVNMIEAFPEVAKIEHELHHGSHEAKIYLHYRYYGRFPKVDQYVDFLYHYASEDYFQLANGDIDFHLRNRRSDFFEFYLDMMDRYCQLNDKDFFVIKMDEMIFTDRKAFNYLTELLRSRYIAIKYIKIQRDLLSSVQSFLHMEGKNYNRRRKWPVRYFFMLSYVQRWYKVSLLKKQAINQEDVLCFDFKFFVKNKEAVTSKLKEKLKLSSGMSNDNQTKEELYRINTSFVGQKRSKMSIFDRYFVSCCLSLLKIFPGLVFVSHYLSSAIKKPTSPIHRRLLKYKYFHEELMGEFKDQGAHGLLTHSSSDGK